MSKEALAKVVQRAISDAGFRRQLTSDPAGALRGFDLSADETSALRMGDAGRLSTLGIDQRMSKAYSLAGLATTTRASQADLVSGTPAMVDDASGATSKNRIPGDPDSAHGSADASGTESVRSADIDGGAAGGRTVHAGDDWKFAGRVAPEGGATARTGDDWKFADRSAGSVAPVEGSPEASAADIARGGVQSVRAGDDWARSSQAAADSARAGTARLDDSSGASGGANAVNDDPDGFLSANKNADLSGASKGGETAFIDESESYLTKVGYDPAATHEVTDAHDRGWSGDQIAGPDTTDSGSTDSTTDGGPNITP